MNFLVTSKKVGLNISQQARYLHFMHKRYAGQENAVCMGGLGERWANIIKSGKEMEYANEQEKAILAAAPKAITPVFTPAPIVTPVEAPAAPVVEPVEVEMKVEPKVEEPVAEVVQVKKGKKKK